MSTSPPTSQCPRCDRTICWDDQFPERPFCSERCKLIDLGDWLTEAHCIPGPPSDTDSMADLADDEG